MPKGRLNPVANVSLWAGLPSAVIPRNTLTSPELLSATKKSPFGAVRISRGPFRPDAYKPTLKPGNTCGHAFAGRSTSFGLFPADGVRNGLGKSFNVIFRT